MRNSPEKTRDRQNDFSCTYNKVLCSFTPNQVLDKKKKKLSDKEIKRKRRDNLNNLDREIKNK